MRKAFADLNLGGVGIWKVGKLFAAVVVGLSLGTLFPPEPVMLPVAGSVSGVVVGGIGLVVGTVLFTQMPGSSGCGCSSDCDC